MAKKTKPSYKQRHKKLIKPNVASNADFKIVEYANYLFKKKYGSN